MAGPAYPSRDALAPLLVCSAAATYPGTLQKHAEHAASSGREPRDGAKLKE